MRQSVGIAVGEGRLRAVVLRAGRVSAATEVELEEGDALPDAVAGLLAALPVARVPRPRVVVAIGPARAQTRRLTGLPPFRDAKLVAQVVRESAGKFFLRNGHPLVTTGARIEEPGTAWCAALDAETVRQAAAGVRTAGLRVDAFVPAVAALPHALAPGRALWRDGSAALEVEMEMGELASVRRLPPGALPGDDPDEAEVVPPLAEIGPCARDFADAYGAAVLPASEALVHRPAAVARPVPTWRVWLAAAAAAGALVAVLVLPPRAARRAADEAAARVSAQAPRLRAAGEVQEGLGRATAALGEVSAFAEARWSPTLLLAELARRLPPGAALVSLHADTAAGSVVALGPRAGAVLAALEGIEGVRRVEISGPVTREGAAGIEVERVTLRFSFDPRARATGEARPAGRER